MRTDNSAVLPLLDELIKSLGIYASKAESFLGQLKEHEFWADRSYAELQHTIDDALTLQRDATKARRMLE